MINKVLFINSLSCILFGLLFLFRPQLTADFLGDVPNLVILILGAALTINGVHLVWASSRTPKKIEVI